LLFCKKMIGERRGAGWLALVLWKTKRKSPGGMRTIEKGGTFNPFAAANKKEPSNANLWESRQKKNAPLFRPLGGSKKPFDRESTEKKGEKNRFSLKLAEFDELNESKEKGVSPSFRGMARGRGTGEFCIPVRREKKKKILRAGILQKKGTV